MRHCYLAQLSLKQIQICKNWQRKWLLMKSFGQFRHLQQSLQICCQLTRISKYLQMQWSSFKDYLNYGEKDNLQPHVESFVCKVWYDVFCIGEKDFLEDMELVRDKRHSVADEILPLKTRCTKALSTLAEFEKIPYQALTIPSSS